MLTEVFRLNDQKWVIQCALSRVCGGCARPLGRPMAFLGTPAELAENAFHVPPLHPACAEQLRAGPGADPTWRIVTAGSFRVVRPDQHDRRLRFVPGAALRR